MGKEVFESNFVQKSNFYIFRNWLVTGIYNGYFQIFKVDE